jgi:phosphatidylethanolamine-binding protein (PEBP) family uncharacterized protein
MHRTQQQKAFLCGLLGMALIVGACGSSASSTRSAASLSDRASQLGTTTSGPTETKGASEKLPAISLPLESSVNAKQLPRRYTCDGANISIPLKWRKLPANTVEVDLFLVNAQSQHGKLDPAWSVAGLMPAQRTLSAGKLPPNAIVGKNQFGRTGYSICPARGSTANYIALLVALPQKVPAKPGFDANALVNRTSELAEFEGRLSFSYKRT